MNTWLILILLFVKHFLADFVWQTERMLKDKGHFGRLGGYEHAGLHGALTYVILMHFLPIQICAVLACFDAILHYHADWFKIHATVKLTVTDKLYWFWFGLDQFIHAMTYLAIAFASAVFLSEYI